jgi:2,4-dienoyl-CoA reductase-like NADH-dependent reductase (Old Yellow Enzyme family)/NADPH-dependent 2,4-dienoyl-CoA reductase/sulfur reductase-like enzyme
MSPTRVAKDLIFSPIRIGNIIVKNRLVMASTTSALGHEGFVSDRNLAYYQRRARGGVGTVVTEALHVHPTSNIGYNNLQVHADAHIPGLARLARAIKDAGAHAIGQLAHIGRQWHSANSRRAPWSASPISSFPVFLEHPHEMTGEEIVEMVDAFGSAARRVREAGFDGIEIHGAHGLLIQQFISGWSNKRTDRYGGSLQNRLRFLLEILAAVRRHAGDDFVVGLKLSAEEFVPGGLTIADTLEIIPLLERTGRLDYFLVSVGGFGAIETIHPTTHYGLAPFIYCAAAVKKVSTLPVMAVGKIKFSMDEVLMEGKADLIAMARPLICDPDLPAKLLEDRELEIRSCLSCNECHGRIWFNHRIGCAFNPEAGNEIDGEVTPAPVRKRVVVVGGGPAGCEAARVAATRGHEVILLERGASLGGRINIAASLPGREDYAAVPIFYAVQLDKLKVDVRLETEATPETVLALAPDAVVVATGTRPWLPDIPGAVGERVWQMERVIAEEPELGRKAVVLDYDNHVAAMATADLLASRGMEVDLVNPYHMVGAEVEINTQTVYYRRLAERGVRVHTNMVPVRIEERRVVLENRFSRGGSEISEVDAVVVCSPGAADAGLASALRARVKELVVVGDAYAPRRLLAGIYDAYRAARAL